MRKYPYSQSGQSLVSHEPRLEKLTENNDVEHLVFRENWSSKSVTVVSAERSFSKLKFIKNNVRSSMVKERLSGLAVISINNKIGHQISYSDFINDSAPEKPGHTGSKEYWGKR